MSHESRDIPEAHTNELKRKHSGGSELKLEEKPLPTSSNPNLLKTLNQRQTSDAPPSKKRILPPKKISLNLSSKVCLVTCFLFVWPLPTKFYSNDVSSVFLRQCQVRDLQSSTLG